MGNWQDYVNNKYKKKDEKQSYAEHVQEKYGNTSNTKEEAVKKTVPSAPKYVGWGSKAQPNSIKRTEAKQPSEFERRLGASDAQRQYNMNRISSMMAQDRERRREAQAEADALRMIQEQEDGTKPALPSFKRQNLAGNSRFSQAEASEEYNPYEDAMNAVKAQLKEQAAEKQKREYIERAQMIPRLTNGNQLLGGTYTAGDYAPPRLDIESRLDQNGDGKGTLIDLLANAPKPSGQMPGNRNALEQSLEIERIKRDEEKRAAYEEANPKPEEQTENGFNAAEWAEANTKAGWTQIGGRIMQAVNAPFEFVKDMSTDAAEWFAGKMYGDKTAAMLEKTFDEKRETPALGAVYDWAVDPMEKATEYADAVNEKGGYLAKIGGSVIQNAVAQIPNAITALMSGGASTMTDAFNRAQTTFGGAVLESAKKMATSPGYWTSFMQMFGGRYEDAADAGANPYQAMLTATLTTLMNSAVEMGGGIEELPFTKATVGDWVKNALDEGKEEAIQQVIDQIGQKMYVDESIPWYSMEDPNAVINPKVLGENALLGALAGGVIGGPGMAVNNALNGNVQEQIEDFSGAPAISDVAMELIQEQNEAGLEPLESTPENKGKGAKYPKISKEETQENIIRQMAQEAADAEIAEEQGTAVGTERDGLKAESGELTVSRPASQPVRANELQAQVTMAAQNVQDEEQKRQFVQTAEKYGEAATVFAHNYEGGDIAAYDRAFNHLYSAGQTNLTLNRIRKATDALTAGMSEGAKQAIWQAGRNADVRTIRPGVQQRTTTKQSNRQKRQFRMLDEIAKRYGYEIDIVDSIAGGMANGAYTGGRRIVVAADAAEGAIVQTGVHELVHALKRSGENEYNVLRDVVLEHLAATGDFDLEYSIKERIAQYRDAGENADREYAIEEIVAEAVPTFLTDEQAVRAFVQKDRTLAEKIRDFFVKFAKEIREIAEKYMMADAETLYDSGRYEIAALLGRSDALTEIAETFDRAMEAAGEKEAADGGEVVFAKGKKEIKGADDVSKWTEDSQFMWKHMSAAERRIFRDALGNIRRLSPQRAKNGEYIIEAGHSLVYTDGNAENPRVTRLLTFDTEDGTELSWIFDMVYDAEKEGVSFDEVRTVLESVFGAGIAAEYKNGVRNEILREDGAGKGTVGRRTSEGNRGEVSSEGEGKFSLNKPVEQAGNLIAVHNLTEDKLKKALKLGGFPMPSIAITKADIGHQNFGDISLVFGRETIDPKANRKNKVYSADAWTPTFPQIQYEEDRKATDRVYAKVRDLAGRLPDEYRNKANSFVGDLEYQMNRYGGEEGLIEAVKDNYGFKAAYLADIGAPVEMAKTTRQEGGVSPAMAERYEKILKIFDGDVYAMLEMPLDEMLEKYREELKAVSAKAATDRIILARVIGNTAKYATGGMETKTVEVDDVAATNRAIDEKIDAGAYEKWLRELFAGVEKQSGVYNGKEIFTPSGNRKSFSQTHYPVTVENIAKAMLGTAGGDAKNVSGFHGAKSLRAATAEAFSSVEAMHKREGRLQARTQEEADALNDRLNERLNNLIDRIVEVKGVGKYDNRLIAMDAVGEILMDVAKKKYSTESIRAEFVKYGYPMDESVAAELKGILDETANMPVNIFEAKPERAVYFDEVKAAIVPESMDENFRKQLNAAVEKVIVYPDGDETARLNALNGLEGVRFSLNNTAAIESMLTEDQNLMLPVDVDVREESIRGAAASALSRGISERMNQQIAGVANKILRETGSTYAKADIIANMKSLIDEYADGGATEETLRAVAEMAKKIIESSSRADNTLREQYADIRKKLRETGISLTETQKQEAANEAGSYNAYRQSLMGTVKLTNDGISLDAIWGELSSQHPELFPADAGEGEMVGKLTDFMLLMKPKYENPYGMDMESAAVEMAMRIQGDMMGVIGAKDAAKAMYGTAEKFRGQFEKEFKAKLSRQKKERVEKFQKIAADLKAAKAKGDSAEQAKIMNRYRAALKATALDEAYAEVRATYKEREAQKAENRKANEMRGRVARQAGELMRMFTRPEKGRRIPTQLQGLVLEALEALDLNGTKAESEGRQTQKAAAFREKLTGIRKFYEDVMNSQSRGEAPEGLDGLMMTISERNLADMQEALEVLGSGDRFYLRDMNSDQLRSLEKLLRNIRHTVDSVGKLWRMQRYASVIELGDASIEEMDSRDGQKLLETTAGGRARDFLALDMLEPVSYGERLGEGGRAVIQNLMEGEKIKFARIREAAAATERMRRDAGVTGYDIGKWRKNVRTVKLGSGRVVKMSDVNIMELYLTANRPQGLQHLLGNGMRIRTTNETGAQTANVPLTEADIRGITGMMTEKQRRIADLMQGYLSGDAAKWGNDVTQRMYLYDAFTEDRYWPLTSDPNLLKSQEPEGDRAFSAIVNAGFTKPLNQLANNPVIIGDAFDTFNRHIGEMASYAGYAEVMTDTMAWINYRQRSEDGKIAGSVKQSIERLLGTGGQKYLTKLVQDINGARRGGDNLRLANALLRNYKANAVAGKIRVAIQQPTSIVRAAAEMNPAYLLTGLKAGKGAVQEMQKWSSLAWWKSHGNYDIGIGRSTDEIFWGETSRADKATDTAAKIGALGLDPGKMDDWAWARIWSAVKREIRRTRRDLAEGSDEYFRAVAQRFEYIVDRTQVVDTVMHRSDMMRSRDGLIQTLTSFKSEPTKSYNMLMRAIMEAGRNPKDKKAYAKLIRTTGAFAASAAATAAATALFDAFKNRDDEDDLWTYLTEGGFWTDWAEAWLNGFAGNINIASSIPLVGEAIEAAQGSDVTMMQFEGIGNIANAAATFTDHFFGDNAKKTTKWGAMKPAITAISQMTGLPAGGMIANAEMLTRIYDPKLMQTKSEMAKLEDAYRVLYEAMAGGNTKKAQDVRAQLTRGLHGTTPKNPKEIDTGIAHALAENDERVMKAYRMREAGNWTQELLRLKKQIMADGFTDAQVTAAINYCESLLDTEKAEKDMTAQLKAKMFDSEDLYNSVRNGSIDDVAAVAEYLESVSEAKDPAKSIKSSVSGEFREEYVGLVKAGKTRQAEELAEKLAIFDLDEEDLLEWMKDDYRMNLKAAVAEGDMDEAEKLVETMRNEYGLDDESIASTVRSRFKQDYIDMVMAGDDRGAEKLAEKLMGLGLKYADGNNRFKQANLNKWVRDWEKEQEEAE